MQDILDMQSPIIVLQLAAAEVRFRFPRFVCFLTTRSFSFLFSFCICSVRPSASRTVRRPLCVRLCRRAARRGVGMISPGCGDL